MDKICWVDYGTGWEKDSSQSFSKHNKGQHDMVVVIAAGDEPQTDQIKGTNDDKSGVTFDNSTTQQVLKREIKMWD